MTDVEAKILEALESMDFGTSCTEIAKIIDVSRPTVLKYLSVMKVKGLVDYKEIGMAKLWHCHKPHLLEMLEDEKKKSDHKLKELLNNLGDGVSIFDKELKFVWINDVFRKQLGRKLSKVKGKYCYDVLKGRKDICSDCYAKKTLETGSTQAYERIYQDSKGKKHHCDILTSPMKDRSNNIIGVLTLSRDITERKKLEKALEKSEERYLEIVANTNIAVYRSTPGRRGNFVEVNPAFFKIFGYKDRSDLLKTSLVSTYYDQKDKKNFDKLMEEQGYVKDWEMRYKRRDGQIIWIRENAIAVKDDHGHIKYYDGTVEDITKRKKLEDALKESERRYRDIFENSYVSVSRVTLGPQGKFIEVNPAYVKMLGYDSKDDLMKVRVCDTYQKPGDRKKFSDKLLKEGLLRNEITKLKKRDGTAITAREVGVVIYDKSGQVKYFDCVTEDITKKKRLEDALQESEGKYRGMVKNLSVGLYRTIHGGGGQWIEANPTMVRMYGYSSKEELFRVPISKLYKNPKERERFNEKVKKRGFVEGEEFEYKKKDGSTFWGRITDQAIYDEKGNVKYWDGVIEEVTERRILREAVKESEEKYHSLVDNAPDVIYSLNAEGKFMSINPTVTKLLGYSSKKLIGSHFTNIIHREDLDKAVTSFKEQLRGKSDSTERLELRFKTKKGKILYGEVSSRATYDEEGKLLKSEGVTRDITARKKLEGALTASESRYQQMMETLPVGVYRTLPGERGQWIDANSATLKILGYDNKEELLSTNVCDIYSDSGVRKKYNKELERDGFTKNSISQIKRKDGSFGWVREKMIAVSDDKGKIKYYDGIIEDVTEEIELGTELRDIEGRYQNIFEEVNVGIYRSTPGKNGEFIDVNSTYLQILGYENKEELMQMKTGADYVNPGGKERFDQRMTDQGCVKDEEIQYKRGDGKIVWIRESAVAVKDTQGRIKYYDGVIEDITKEKKLEDALKKSEEKYRSLVENVPDIIYSLNNKGELITINEVGLDSLGYQAGEIIGSHFSKIVHPDDLERARKSFKELIEKKRGTTKDLEVRLRKKGGGTLWCELNAKATYDKGGKLVRTEGVIRDISERRRREERYWRILESSKDATYITTRNGKLLHMNPAGIRLLGYQKWEELSRIDNVEQSYVNPADRKKFRKIIEQNGFVNDFPTKLRGKNGIVIKVLITSNVKKDNQGKIIGYEGIIKKA